MQTNQLKNPAFVEGWNGWTLVYTAGANPPTVSNGGLYKGNGQGNDMPTVPEYYVELVNVITATDHGTTTWYLTSSDSYSFAEGDVIAFDCGVAFTSHLGGESYQLDLIVKVGSTTVETIRLAANGSSSFWLADGTMQKFAFRCSAALTGQLKIGIEWSVSGAHTANSQVSKLGIDNIMVYPACNYASLTNRRDQTGLVIA